MDKEPKWKKPRPKIPCVIVRLIKGHNEIKEIKLSFRNRFEESYKYEGITEKEHIWVVKDHEQCYRVNKVKDHYKVTPLSNVESACLMELISYCFPVMRKMCVNDRPSEKAKKGINLWSFQEEKK